MTSAVLVPLSNKNCLVASGLTVNLPSSTDADMVKHNLANSYSRSAIKFHPHNRFVPHARMARTQKIVRESQLWYTENT